MKRALAVVGVCALIAVAGVAIPMYVIRPFRPQGAEELALALGVRRVAPVVSGLCALVAVAAAIWFWKRTKGVGLRVALVGLCLVAVVGACAAQVNIFEVMFHPYDAPVFDDASVVKVDADDKVLGVRIAGEAHAYPVRTMGYHHIVNDTVGGVPIAATYCTLCHTGMVWNRVVDGRTLHFRLAGINNGNALMRDEETSTIWQQSTGQGIFGPMKGRQLELVHSNELTFATWRGEQPNGKVLKPDQAYVAEYDPKDWEKHVEKTRTVVDTSRTGTGPHVLMLGVSMDGKSKAYPIEAVLAAKVVQDEVGEAPVLIVVGPDGSSIRVFDPKIDGVEPLTFVKGASADKGVVDAETGSVWSFQGCAVEGKLAGRCLKERDANKDYWFDWLNHHPGSAVFKS